MTYNPVTDLAGIIDGLHDVLAAGTYAGIMTGLAELAAGPYAGLRGGLLLDERGRENVRTEDAIREALREAVIPQLSASQAAEDAEQGMK